jgi:hypothetical protein
VMVQASLTRRDTLSSTAAPASKGRAKFMRR